MRLNRLSLINFKNVEQLELQLDQGINCLVGDNGTGKTNLLDAVYYLSMCKSSLGTSDTQNIRHGNDFFLLEGNYLTDAGRAETIVCSYSRKGGKVIKRNGKEYPRMADHVGLLPAVAVLPSDAAMITDAADERRRHLNAFISQLDAAYLNRLIRYNAVLSERNRLLKGTASDQMLDVYDMQLAQLGEQIHIRRTEAVARIEPYVSEFYRMLSDGRERIELRYRSELDRMQPAELLLSTRDRDRACQFTGSGIHRDDLLFGIGGYPLRRFGSQGQQKSFLIALKLAQCVAVAEHKGEKPVLLLDDLFDKLDAERVARLIGLVTDSRFGQILITDCNPHRLREILDRKGCPYRLYRVANGTVGS